MSCSFVIPSSKLSPKTCIGTNNSVFNIISSNRAVMEDQGPGLPPPPHPRYCRHDTQLLSYETKGKLNQKKFRHVALQFLISSSHTQLYPATWTLSDSPPVWLFHVFHEHTQINVFKKWINYHDFNVSPVSSLQPQVLVSVPQAAEHWDQVWLLHKN